MPLRDYKCSACGATEEDVLTGIEPGDHRCPECGAPMDALPGRLTVPKGVGYWSKPGRTTWKDFVTAKGRVE